MKSLAGTSRSGVLQFGGSGRQGVHGCHVEHLEFPGQLREMHTYLVESLSD